MADYNYAKNFTEAEALAVVKNSIRERVINVGRPLSLSGIATSVEDARKDIAFIILNSGVVHRIGACRLSVEVARQLTASTGITSVRFDYSGLGDSPVRRSELERNQLAQAEVSEVMDFLQGTQGVNEFILFGLCSGARDAVHTAAVDSRVIGVVQLDGYAFRNLKYYVQHYRARVFSTAQWRRFLFEALPNRLRRVGKKPLASESEAGAASGFDLPIESIWGAYMSRELVAQMYDKLAQRKVPLFVHFTGSWAHEYNYPKQFFDMFAEVDFSGCVHEQFCPHMDHIHSNPEHRSQLIDTVVAWVDKRWAKSSAR